jgi:hypothetical protein
MNQIDNTNNFNYTLTRRVNQTHNYTLAPSPHNSQFNDDELPILTIVIPIVSVVLFCICCLKVLLSRA